MTLFFEINLTNFLLAYLRKNGWFKNTFHFFSKKYTNKIAEKNPTIKMSRLKKPRINMFQLKLLHQGIETTSRLWYPG